MSDLLQKASKVKSCVVEMGKKTTEQKNDALRLIADELVNQIPYIVQENQKDIVNGRENGYHESLLDRLLLHDDRIKDMADALIQLTKLDDPIGETIDSWDRPNGLKIQQVRVPLGVIGMIYEARPNVTVDAASLCLKTGNAVLLRGSSSAIHSNTAIVKVIHDALAKSELPIEAVQLVEDTSRETASKMFKMNEYLDVLIPRGGKKLIDTVVAQASVPVLETGAGNCHLYIDESAQVKMAIDIAINAKTQRPSVCNAIETLLIHEKWAASHLKDLISTLQDNQVEIRADDKTLALVDGLKPASDEDWKTEFLDKIIAVKIVASTEEAIDHINTYGSKHSESIISETNEHVVDFLNTVDAAAVYHNSSTRFTDGFEFGFGAEIGISTQKLHARGPMGLKALTSSKYLLYGNGQIK
ncbi:glutamate-5-semialdehyde dehydrogenase [Aquibacillus koreensis]|uniref:Gamma-glutamyl phosphate reductase n=1 Tax=Aquibacillus koreensis TaxID=279446 RepID=A0A9X4AKC3_9BACI|nr:glutamate-5-semialdehyde dehydrogenase [Aquibacillus koreensis]MCT2536349.1 glutamate-5-semialdehyde dehydrogenase [Aquibacillus koreensis]MDC3421300.1 glutamate-5-semialdehyde dehydrogenase [Aquibacillus koreensis]